MKARKTRKGNIKVTLTKEEAVALKTILNFSGRLVIGHEASLLAGISRDHEAVSLDLHSLLGTLDIQTDGVYL